MSCGIVGVAAKQAADPLITDTRRLPRGDKAVSDPSGGQNP